MYTLGESSLIFMGDYLNETFFLGAIFEVLTRSPKASGAPMLRSLETIFVSVGVFECVLIFYEIDDFFRYLAIVHECLQ